MTSSYKLKVRITHAHIMCCATVSWPLCTFEAKLNFFQFLLPSTSQYGLQLLERGGLHLQIASVLQYT